MSLRYVAWWLQWRKGQHGWHWFSSALMRLPSETDIGQISQGDENVRITCWPDSHVDPVGHIGSTGDLHEDLTTRYFGPSKEGTIKSSSGDVERRWHNGGICLPISVHYALC